MKRLVTSIAASTILAAGLLPIIAHVSVPRAAQSSPMVVATWFSNLHPNSAKPKPKKVYPGALLIAS